MLLLLDIGTNLPKSKLIIVAGAPFVVFTRRECPLGTGTSAHPSLFFSIELIKVYPRRNYKYYLETIGGDGGSGGEPWGVAGLCPRRER